MLHLLIWIMLLGIPYLLSGEAIVFQQVVKRSWIPMAMYALLFYVNYLYLIPRYFFDKKQLWFLLFNLIMVGILIWFKQEVVSDLFTATDPLKSDGASSGGPPRPPKGMFVYIDTLSLIVPVIFAVALSMADRWKKMEAIRNQTERERLQSELKHLKYQLQPHFFFNALNNIYAMVDVSPGNAKIAIHNLSKLMRYFLYETTDEQVLLSKEVDFLHKFIELMKLRFSDNTQVQTDFAADIPAVKVAPLLFIAIVENAFKHGVSATKPSTISFGLSVNENELTFTSSNKNYPKTTADKSGSGIGLENLKKRLELIYPNAHRLSTFIDEDDYYKLSLSITVNDQRYTADGARPGGSTEDPVRGAG